MMIPTSTDMVVVSDEWLRWLERRNSEMLDYRLLYEIGRLDAETYAGMLKRELDHLEFKP